MTPSPTTPQGAEPREDGAFKTTDQLVDEFAAALKDKLNLAADKYGYTNGWMRVDWRDNCIADLNRHLAKGDPRDVAAYCAFAWHHGWSTAPAAPTNGGGESEGWREVTDEVKDGREVLAFVPGLGMGLMVLFWMDGYWREKANMMGLKIAPTHYMPLPAPPVPLADGGR